MIKEYYSLTKPGLVYGNLIPVIAGFIVGTRGYIDASSFFVLIATIIGIALIMGSGCVFNNYIDRDIDAKMARTKDRPLVTGRISGFDAIIYGTILGVIGILLLFIYTNWLDAIIAGFGFFAYVSLYSKRNKRETAYGAHIGAIAGAIPPVVGYTASSGRLDLGAILLFAMLFFWQIPHFFAIAMYRSDDYAAAGIPVLPNKKGNLVAKIHILLYIAAFTIASLALSFFGYLNYSYFTVSLLLGLAWFVFAVSGFFSNNEKLWAHKMFLISLMVMVTTFIAMIACVVL